MGRDRHTTVRVLPFHRHASVTCPAPAALAASLASEFGAYDADGVERALTALGAAVLPESESRPAAQLAALGETVTNCVLAVRPAGELRLDRVLARGHGHALPVAIVLQEIGRRASLPVGIVSGARGPFVAHQRLTEPLVLDPVTGRLADADMLGVLRWRCGHQVAAELLDLLEARFERNGDLTRTLHAARLRCALPFDGDAAGLRLRAVAARLN